MSQPMLSLRSTILAEGSPCDSVREMSAWTMPTRTGFVEPATNPLFRRRPLGWVDAENANGAQAALNDAVSAVPLIPTRMVYNADISGNSVEPAPVSGNQKVDAVRFGRKSDGRTAVTAPRKESKTSGDSTTSLCRRAAPRRRSSSGTFLGWTLRGSRTLTSPLSGYQSLTSPDTSDIE